MTSTWSPSALRRDRRHTVASLVVAIVVAVLGAGVAAGVVLARGPVYESHALLIIDQPRVLAVSSDAGVIVKLNSLRLKYAALTDTSVISAPVAERLALPEGLVRERSRAEATFDALVMRTVGRAGTREEAQAIAQAVAEVLVGFVDQEQAALPIDPADRVQLRIVEGAFPGARVEPEGARALFVALATGVLVLAVVFVTSMALLQRRASEE